MQLWGITDCGSVRKENQDAYDICPMGDESGFGVVCDGMGGAKAGNVASRLAVESAGAVLRENASCGGDWKDSLTKAVEQANEAVYRQSLQDEECRGMGTTFVAAVVDGGYIDIVNVGDSRCYLVDEEAIVQVTRDHSWVEDLVARGDITPEEARCHPRKNLITRALGVERLVHPDLFRLERKAGSYLLLCSDGLSNVVTDPELLYEIVHGGQPSDCCRRLLEIAISRGAPDNVTAVLMQL